MNVIVNDDHVESNNDNNSNTQINDQIALITLRSPTAKFTKRSFMELLEMES